MNKLMLMQLPTASTAKTTAFSEDKVERSALQVTYKTAVLHPEIAEFMIVVRSKNTQINKINIIYTHQTQLLWLPVSAHRE